MTLRRSTKSTELTPFSNIRNRASASLAGSDLWISELVLTYDGEPFYMVSIMEFEGGEVVRETQYFGEAFEPGPSRAQWVERNGVTSPDVAHEFGVCSTQGCLARPAASCLT
jgi:hypothetical protein